MYLDNEECLYEIPDVFFCGHGTAQSKELGQFVVVDFLTGVVFALDGTIQKIGHNVILCAPRNVAVDGEIKLDGDDD